MEIFLWEADVNKGWKEGATWVVILSLVLMLGLFSGCASVRAPVKEAAPVEEEAEARPEVAYEM